MYVLSSRRLRNICWCVFGLYKTWCIMKNLIMCYLLSCREFLNHLFCYVLIISRPIDSIVARYLSLTLMLFTSCHLHYPQFLPPLTICSVLYFKVSVFINPIIGIILNTSKMTDTCYHSCHHVLSCDHHRSTVIMC